MSTRCGGNIRQLGHIPTFFKVFKLSFGSGDFLVQKTAVFSPLRNGFHPTPLNMSAEDPPGGIPCGQNMGAHSHAEAVTLPDPNFEEQLTPVFLPKKLPSKNILLFPRYSWSCANGCNRPNPKFLYPKSYPRGPDWYQSLPPLVWIPSLSNFLGGNLVPSLFGG